MAWAVVRYTVIDSKVVPNSRRQITGECENKQTAKWIAYQLDDMAIEDGEPLCFQVELVPEGAQVQGSSGPCWVGEDLCSGCRDGIGPCDCGREE